MSWAVGIEDNDIKATQINFTTGKTNLDKMIESMNYEQLLEFIAEIKKELERRGIK